MKRSIIALLLCLCVVQAEALNLGEIRTVIRRNVRDTATVTTLRRYSDSYLNDLINEAQRDVINQTYAISLETSMSVVNGRDEYVTPERTIKVWRVTRVFGNLPEVELSKMDADFNNEPWQEELGVPAYFYMKKSDPHYVFLYPVPNDSLLGTLRIEYYAYPEDLVNDTDDPYSSIDELAGYDDLLVYHPTARILIVEGKLDRAQSYIGLYESGIKLMSENLGYKPIKVPAVPVTTKP